VVVRGEIYANVLVLKQSTSEKSELSLRHPRHVAAGVLQAHNPDAEALAALRFFPFELVSVDAVEGLHTDRASLQMLSEWGFPVDAAHTRSAETFAEIQAVYGEYLATRDQQPFAMDGIVVKVDDLKVRKLMGEGARAPFWGAAWKFPADSAVTQVREIRWTVGRSGRRTPVAEVEPLRVGGVLVSRVSLHNRAGVERLDIAVGDRVVVALVGDVIPQIAAVVDRTTRKTATGTVLAHDAAPLKDACLSDSADCRQQFLARVAYFVSKRGLNIAGLGRGRLKKLVDAGLVVDLPSLFQLKVEDVVTVPGFSEITAQRLILAIQAAARPDSFRLVTALGIPGVGQQTVQRLSRQFSSLDALLAAGPDKLAALSKADRRAAEKIRSFCATPEGEELLKKWRELLETKYPIHQHHSQRSPFTDSSADDRPGDAGFQFALQIAFEGAGTVDRVIARFGDKS
jgi:DNA ligase (NAD+)